VVLLNKALKADNRFKEPKIVVLVSGISVVETGDLTHFGCHYPSTDRKVVPPPTAKVRTVSWMERENGQEVHATNGDDKKNDSMMRLYV
jgi:hypothetical protein